MTTLPTDYGAGHERSSSHLTRTAASTPGVTDLRAAPTAAVIADYPSAQGARIDPDLDHTAACCDAHGCGCRTGCTGSAGRWTGNATASPALST